MKFALIGQDIPMLLPTLLADEKAVRCPLEKEDARV